MVPAQTAFPGARLKKTSYCMYEYDIRIRYTIRGDSFFDNLAGLISDKPNKIQGCSTTGFGDNDLNCGVG